MEPQDTCPQSQQLTDLIQGVLSDEQDAMLREHVETCQVCQDELQRLVGDDEAADSVSDHLRKPRSTSDSALLQVIDRLKTPPWEDQTKAEKPEGGLPLDFLDPSDEPDSLGRLAQYEITEVVGRGGMGIVLKGVDTKLNRVVAVKVLAPEMASNSTARKRFLREARAAAAVSHDHVVTIYAVEQAQPPYLVMEFIDGQSLQQKIDREGDLKPREILRIGMQTASGLAAAHAQGLIHRDIKPSNILLQNGIERVQITDFGLARAVDDVRMTRTGDVAGTPQYMSPEQAQGQPVDPRADLFSLGSVLYTMCTGRSPFRAESTLATIRRVCDDTPRPIQEINPEVPPWLVEIIDRLLAKNPEERFQTAAEVSDLLGRHLAHVQDPLSAPFPGSVAAAQLGSPSQWIPEDVSSRMRRQRARVRQVLERLRSGPEDFRLAYITVTLLGAAVLLPAVAPSPIPPLLCLTFSFLFARSTLAIASVPAELGAQRWLLYPTLVIVYVHLIAALMLWPLLLAICWATETRLEAIHLPAAGRVPIWMFASYMAVAGTSFWWLIVGVVSWRRPALVRQMFYPFADRFRGRYGLWLTVISLLMFAATTVGCGLAVFAWR